MAEKEPNAFQEGEAPLSAWPKFRENLIGLTDVTRSHFEKLVQARPCPPWRPRPPWRSLSEARVSAYERRQTQECTVLCRHPLSGTGTIRLASSTLPRRSSEGREARCAPR